MTGRVGLTAEMGAAGDADVALVCQQAGGPQQALAKFASLLLNYQFGLSVQVSPHLGKAAAAVTLQRQVRCVFVIQDQPILDEPMVRALTRSGTVPLFIAVPARAVPAQRQACQGVAQVHLCPWETAFTAAESSLPQVVAAALSQLGFGGLLQDLGKVPYAEVRQRAERRLRSINTLPTLPEVVLRLMRLINDPNTSAAQVEDLLCRDPAIVMKLMQVVRSPVFAPTVRTSGMNLTEIITRLGMRKVAAIAQQIKVINGLVRPAGSGFDLRRFWTHSVATATVADRLCERRLVSFGGSVSFTEYWIAALLHDVGKLVLGFFFWDWFARVMDYAPLCDHQFREAEAYLGDVVDHERIGCLLALNADLGETLANTIAMHHTVGDSPGPLLCLVHLADNLSKDLGLGYSEAATGHYEPAVLDACGLSADRLEAVRRNVGQNLAESVGTLVDDCV